MSSHKLAKPERLWGSIILERSLCSFSWLRSAQDPKLISEAGEKALMLLSFIHSQGPVSLQLLFERQEKLLGVLQWTALQERASTKGNSSGLRHVWNNTDHRCSCPCQPRNRRLWRRLFLVTTSDGEFSNTAYLRRDVGLAVSSPHSKWQILSLYTYLISATGLFFSHRQLNWVSKDQKFHSLCFVNYSSGS